MFLENERPSDYGDLEADTAEDYAPYYNEASDDWDEDDSDD